MTSLIWVGVSVWRISLVCACTALYPTADKGCTAMDDDDGYGYKKEKRLPANGAVGAKRCRGKRVSGPGATTRSPARVGGSSGDGGDDGWW